MAVVWRFVGNAHGHTKRGTKLSGNSMSESAGEAQMPMADKRFLQRLDGMPRLQRNGQAVRLSTLRLAQSTIAPADRRNHPP